MPLPIARQREKDVSLSLSLSHCEDVSLRTATCLLTISSLSRAAFNSALAFSKAKRLGSTSQ